MADAEDAAHDGAQRPKDPVVGRRVKVTEKKSAAFGTVCAYKGKLPRTKVAYVIRFDDGVEQHGTFSLDWGEWSYLSDKELQGQKKAGRPKNPSTIDWVDGAPPGPAAGSSQQGQPANGSKEPTPEKKKRGRPSKQRASSAGLEDDTPDDAAAAEPAPESRSAEQAAGPPGAHNSNGTRSQSAPATAVQDQEASPAVAAHSDQKQRQATPGKAGPSTNEQAAGQRQPATQPGGTAQTTTGTQAASKQEDHKESEAADRPVKRGKLSHPSLAKAGTARPQVQMLPTPDTGQAAAGPSNARTGAAGPSSKSGDTKPKVSPAVLTFCKEAQPTSHARVVTRAADALKVDGRHDDMDKESSLSPDSKRRRFSSGSLDPMDTDQPDMGQPGAPAPEAGTPAAPAPDSPIAGIPCSSAPPSARHEAGSPVAPEFTTSPLSRGLSTTPTAVASPAGLGRAVSPAYSPPPHAADKDLATTPIATATFAAGHGGIAQAALLLNATGSAFAQRGSQRSASRLSLGSPELADYAEEGAATRPGSASGGDLKPLSRTGSLHPQLSTQSTGSPYQDLVAHLSNQVSVRRPPDAPPGSGGMPTPPTSTPAGNSGQSTTTLGVGVKTTRLAAASRDPRTAAAAAGSAGNAVEVVVAAPVRAERGRQGLQLPSSQRSEKLSAFEEALSNLSNTKKSINETGQLAVEAAQSGGGNVGAVIRAVVQRAETIQAAAAHAEDAATAAGFQGKRLALVYLMDNILQRAMPHHSSDKARSETSTSEAVARDLPAKLASACRHIIPGCLPTGDGAVDKADKLSRLVDRWGSRGWLGPGEVKMVQEVCDEEVKRVHSAAVAQAPVAGAATVEPGHHRAGLMPPSALGPRGEKFWMGPHRVSMPLAASDKSKEPRAVPVLITVGDIEAVAKEDVSFNILGPKSDSFWLANMYGSFGISNLSGHCDADRLSDAWGRLPRFKEDEEEDLFAEDDLDKELFGNAVSWRNFCLIRGVGTGESTDEKGVAEEPPAGMPQGMRQQMGANTAGMLPPHLAAQQQMMMQQMRLQQEAQAMSTAAAMALGSTMGMGMGMMGGGPPHLAQGISQSLFGMNMASGPGMQQSLLQGSMQQQGSMMQQQQLGGFVRDQPRPGEGVLDSGDKRDTHAPIIPSSPVLVEEEDVGALDANDVLDEMLVPSQNEFTADGLEEPDYDEQYAPAAPAREDVEDMQIGNSDDEDLGGYDSSPNFTPPPLPPPLPPLPEGRPPPPPSAHHWGTHAQGGYHHHYADPPLPSEPPPPPDDEQPPLPDMDEGFQPPLPPHRRPQSTRGEPRAAQQSGPRDQHPLEGGRDQQGAGSKTNKVSQKSSQEKDAAPAVASPHKKRKASEVSQPEQQHSKATPAAAASKQPPQQSLFPSLTTGLQQAKLPPSSGGGGGGGGGGSGGSGSVAVGKDTGLTAGLSLTAGLLMPLLPTGGAGPTTKRTSSGQSNDPGAVSDKQPPAGLPLLPPGLLPGSDLLPVRASDDQDAQAAGQAMMRSRSTSLGAELHVTEQIQPKDKGVSAATGVVDKAGEKRSADPRQAQEQQRKPQQRQGREQAATRERSSSRSPSPDAVPPKRGTRQRRSVSPASTSPRLMEESPPRRQEREKAPAAGRPEPEKASTARQSGPLQPAASRDSPKQSKSKRAPTFSAPHDGGSDGPQNDYPPHMRDGRDRGRSAHSRPDDARGGEGGRGRSVEQEAGRVNPGPMRRLTEGTRWHEPQERRRSPERAELRGLQWDTHAPQQRAPTMLGGSGRRDSGGRQELELSAQKHQRHGRDIRAREESEHDGWDDGGRGGRGGRNRDGSMHSSRDASGRHPAHQDRVWEPPRDHREAARDGAWDRERRGQPEEGERGQKPSDRRQHAEEREEDRRQERGERVERQRGGEREREGERRQQHRVRSEEPEPRLRADRVSSDAPAAQSRAAQERHHAAPEPEPGPAPAEHKVSVLERIKRKASADHASAPAPAVAAGGDTGAEAGPSGDTSRKRKEVRVRPGGGLGAGFIKKALQGVLPDK